MPRHAPLSLRVFLFPLGLAGLWYGLALLAAWLIFDVALRPAALPRDLLLHGGLALLLWGMLRQRWLYGALLGLITAFLHLGHAAKLAQLGGPIVPDDFFALRALLLILEPAPRLALQGAVGAVALLLLCGFAWRQRRAYLALGAGAALGTGLLIQAVPVVQWLDAQVGNVEWDQADNYRQRGPFLYTLQEGLRHLAARQAPPDALQVAAALPPPELMPAAWPGAAQAARNLHMIVLESFWDAGRLGAADFDTDPLVAEFRALWEAGGRSEALSPVFGGYTANAEFEALCGFPVTEAAVAFERRVLRQVPCLPAVLAQAGYVTVAAHPNIPVFWNRNNAYRRIGFDTYWAGQDFIYDDMNGPFLGDRSLYGQVLDKVGALLDSGQPLFNYILTIYGHLDYPASEQRPEYIISRSAVPEVGRYASATRYKSAELVEFLQELRRRDPDGLIVVFGDHLPVLGDHFAGYVESGVLAAAFTDFTPAQYVDHVATPLLMIDGRQGPLAVGRVPMYELPALILERLGHAGPTIFDYSRPPAGMRVRPLVGLHLNLTADGVDVCREAEISPACAASEDWLARVQVLERDLFGGGQHALPQPRPLEAEPLDAALEVVPRLPPVAAEGV